MLPDEDHDVSRAHLRASHRQRLNRRSDREQQQEHRRGPAIVQPVGAFHEDSPMVKKSAASEARTSCIVSPVGARGVGATEE